VVSAEKISIVPSIVGSGGDDVIKIAGMKTPEIEEETVVADDMKLLVGEVPSNMPFAYTLQGKRTG